jgi:hypothetical protein
MRPTLRELDALFDEFNAKYFGGRVTKVPIVINERLTRTAGRATWAYSMADRTVMDSRGNVSTKLVQVCVPKKLELSGPVFDYYGWDYQRHNFSMIEWQKTFVHEMVHLYLAEHYNDEGHSTHFHHMMTDITGIHGNHRCHHMSVGTVTANKKPKPIRKGRVAGTGISLGSLRK